jgi:hypothetical protein
MACHPMFRPRDEGMEKDDDRGNESRDDRDGHDWAEMVDEKRQFEDTGKVKGQGEYEGDVE